MHRLAETMILLLNVITVYSPYILSLLASYYYVLLYLEEKIFTSKLLRHPYRHDFSLCAPFFGATKEMYCIIHREYNLRDFAPFLQDLYGRTIYTYGISKIIGNYKMEEK